MGKDISVVIPTLNAGPGFAQTLERIESQQGYSAEIIVVDSGSEDGTAELAERFGARVLRIPQSSFNHGETRNLGISRSSGEICVLLTQDAVPASDRWLARLLEPFSSADVAGAAGGETPCPRAEPFARYWNHRRNGTYGADRRELSLESWDRFLSLPYQKRLRLIRFSHVNAALRRSAWERIPYRPLPFGEDVDWAVRALRAGCRLMFLPEADVIHSHSRTARYTLRRSYLRSKIIPALLHVRPAAPPGLGANGDETDLRRQIKELTAIAKPGYSDWDEVLNCEPLRIGSRNGTAAQNGAAHGGILVGQFRETIRELTSFYENPSPESIQRGVEQVVGTVVGEMLGTYYRWRQAEGPIGPELERLDARLSRGI